MYKDYINNESALVENSYGLFRSLEREESRGEESRGEESSGEESRGE